MSRGADALVRTLAAAGVRKMFALSGNHVMPVFDAALDAGVDIIHVRHEAAAVHMADAWARLTGEVGVALVTGGPGHANAVSALYTALEAESPVLLLSGHAPLGELGKGAFQEMRQADMAAPVTRASWTMRSIDEIGRALREAQAGPVHLSLPQDVLDARFDGSIHLPAPVSEPKEPWPDELFTAKRPLVIAGPGMMRKSRGLEEASGIPVIGMESPRGVNDPALGKLADVLACADAVLLLGKKLDFTLRFGNAFAPDCRLLTSQSIWPSRKANGSAWLDEVRAALAYRPPQWKQITGSLHPVAVCRGVQELLKESDAVLVCDGGEFGQWAQACLRAPHRVINGPAGSIGREARVTTCAGRRDARRRHVRFPHVGDRHRRALRFELPRGCRQRRLLERRVPDRAQGLRQGAGEEPRSPSHALRRRFRRARRARGGCRRFRGAWPGARASQKSGQTGLRQRTHRAPSGAQILKTIGL